MYYVALVWLTGARLMYVYHIIISSPNSASTTTLPQTNSDGHTDTRDIHGIKNKMAILILISDVGNVSNLAFLIFSLWKSLVVTQ